MYLNNKGQAVVELAASLFLLIMLVFGMISVGCYIYDKNVFNFAVNKALDRAIAVSMSGNLNTNDQNEIKNLAVNYVNGRVFTSDPVVNLTIDSSNREITLSIESNYNCFVPYFTEIFGNNPKVSEKSTYKY